MVSATVSEVGKVVNPEVENTIEEAETRMIKSWNCRGEPWAIIDPEDGKIVEQGPGGLLWVWVDDDGWHEDDVTGLFSGFSEKDFGVACFSDVNYSRLSQKLNSLYESESITSKELGFRDKLEKLLESHHGGCLKLSAVGLPPLLITRNIVTHFHPEDISFSKRDFWVALNNDPLEMRVFGHKYLFVFRDVASRIKSSMYEEVIRGYRSKDRDSFWRKKAEEFGFYYERSLSALELGGSQRK